MTLEPKVHFTASYTMSREPCGYRFLFRCADCASGYGTGLITAESVEDAYGFAVNEARRCFNACHKCGEWVCDAHYNEDEMQCLKCAPRKEDGG